MEKEPKFVMPTIWLFLLRYYSVTKNKEALAKQMKLAAQFGKTKLPPGHTVEVKPGRNDIVLNLVD